MIFDDNEIQDFIEVLEISINLLVGMREAGTSLDALLMLITEPNFTPPASAEVWSKFIETFKIYLEEKEEYDQLTEMLARMYRPPNLN